MFIVFITWNKIEKTFLLLVRKHCGTTVRTENIHTQLLFTYSLIFTCNSLRGNTSDHMIKEPMRGTTLLDLLLTGQEKLVGVERKNKIRLFQ